MMTQNIPLTARSTTFGGSFEVVRQRLAAESDFTHSTILGRVIKVLY
jgi:hypothetical protein